MNFRVYTNGKNKINATEKAFSVVYKRLGYTEESEASESPENDLEDGSNTLAYDEITKDEIISELEELEIDHVKRNGKRELFELLKKER